MSVGDINGTTKGTAARFNDGKPDFSFIPFETLEEETRVWMKGAIKYKKFNWQRGMDWSVPFASMMRHMSQWQAGEDRDPETGCLHIAHAMANLRMLMYFYTHYQEGDDRFKGCTESVVIQPVMEVPKMSHSYGDISAATEIVSQTNETFVSNNPETHGWTANATNKSK